MTTLAHHPHVKATCPVCGVELAFTLREDAGGTWSILLTPQGETHIDNHYT